MAIRFPSAACLKRGIAGKKVNIRFLETRKGDMESLPRYLKTLKLHNIPFMHYRRKISRTKWSNWVIVCPEEECIQRRFWREDSEILEIYRGTQKPSPAFLGWVHDEMVFKAHERLSQAERDRLLLGEWK